MLKALSFSSAQSVLLHRYSAKLKMDRSRLLANALFVLNVLVLAWFVARDELTLKPVNLPLSLLILVFSFALCFGFFISFKERANLARECFLLSLGAFSLFALFSFFWQWVSGMRLISEVAKVSSSFRFIGEIFFYLIPIFLVLFLMRLGYGGDWANRYFIRFEFRLADFGILLALSVLTVIGMSLWFNLFSRGQSSWSTLGFSPILAFFLGIVSAVGNAISEEFWFRGFFFATFTRLSTPRLALILQAILFGFIHFKDGIPSGWIGLILASIWGLFLGVWTLSRLSLWPAVFLHFLTDAFIYFTVNFQAIF